MSIEISILILFEGIGKDFLEDINFVLWFKVWKKFVR